MQRNLWLLAISLLLMETPWVIADIYHLLDTIIGGDFDITKRDHYLLVAGIASEWLYFLPMIACPVMFAEATGCVCLAAKQLITQIESATRELKRQIKFSQSGAQQFGTHAWVAHFLRTFLDVERRVDKLNCTFGVYLLVTFVTLLPQWNLEIHNLIYQNRQQHNSYSESLEIATRHRILWKQVLSLVQNGVVPCMLIFIASRLADQVISLSVTYQVLMLRLEQKQVCSEMCLNATTTIHTPTSRLEFHP